MRGEGCGYVCVCEGVGSFMSRLCWLNMGAGGGGGRGHMC